MPSHSKSQQRLFGMVHAAQQGELKHPSGKIRSMAKSISKSDVTHFAQTKHKGLPEKAAGAVSAFAGIGAQEAAEHGAGFYKSLISGVMNRLRAAGPMAQTTATTTGILGGGAAAGIGLGKLTRPAVAAPTPATAPAPAPKPPVQPGPTPQQAGGPKAPSGFNTQVALRAGVPLAAAGIAYKLLSRSKRPKPPYEVKNAAARLLGSLAGHMAAKAANANCPPGYTGSAMAGGSPVNVTQSQSFSGNPSAGMSFMRGNMGY